ncbi:AAA family ATPase, partial [Candidatus Woesearchaeota archaeon]|nr:AAA family ATPase [Candidatus Woesearchaeota archaeon]
DVDKEEKKFIGEKKSLEVVIGEKTVLLSDKEKEQEKFFVQFKSLFEQRNVLSEKVNRHESETLRLEEFSRQEELLLNTFSIETARIKAEHAGLSAEFSQYEGCEFELKKSDEELKKEIEEHERMLVSIGSVNLRALEIYDAVEKEYNGLIEKRSVLVKEKDDVLRLMNEIEANKTGLFTNTLSVVDKNFRTIFSEMSTKGEAFLELENPEKPFDEGLRIKVRISGSKFLDIRSLSGGEKTLTALAFLFAIQEHEPASFYVMDEVDAALDKHNSDKLAKLIRKYCGKAQYIVISHNDALTMEADTLYGVSMNPDLGISSVVGLKV